MRNIFLPFKGNKQPLSCNFPRGTQRWRVLRSPADPRSVPGEQRGIPAISAGGGEGFGEVWGGLGVPCFSAWELGDLREGTGKDILDQSSSSPRVPTLQFRAEMSQGRGLGVSPKHPQTRRGLQPAASALLTTDLRQFINLCSDLSAHLQSP